MEHGATPTRSRARSAASEQRRLDCGSREQQGELFLRDATPCVRDFEASPGIFPPAAERQRPALRHGVDGVMYQVEQHTAKGIAMQGHLPQVGKTL
jgi:hypothetical protein